MINVVKWSQTNKTKQQHQILLLLKPPTKLNMSTSHPRGSRHSSVRSREPKCSRTWEQGTELNTPTAHLPGEVAMGQTAKGLHQPIKWFSFLRKIQSHFLVSWHTILAGTFDNPSPATTEKSQQGKGWRDTQLHSGTALTFSEAHASREDPCRYCSCCDGREQPAPQLSQHMGSCCTPS